MRPDEEHIEEWIKFQTDRLEVTPEPEIWDRLSDSLDQEEVWGRLDQSLEKREMRGFWMQRAAVAAVILALFAVGLWWMSQTSVLDSDTANENFAGNAGESLIPAPTTGNTQTLPFIPLAFNQDKTATPPIAKNVTQAPVWAETNNPIDLTPVPEREEFLLTERQPIQVDPLLAKQVELPVALHEAEPEVEDIQNILATIPGPIPKFEDPNEQDSRFYVGAAVGVKNQWLMNHDTYQTFRSDGLDQAVADFSTAQNINMGWRIADRFGMQADYSFLAGGGQKYQEYGGGRYVPRELDFQYQKMLLTFRYNRRSKKLLGREISDHFAMGMYGGYLTEAQRIGGLEGSAKVLPEYRNVDFGFTGAYEINYALLPRLKFSTGLRLQQGLMNIYRGNSSVPADFDRTFNASVDLLFGLKYELQKIR